MHNMDGMHNRQDLSKSCDLALNRARNGFFSLAVFGCVHMGFRALETRAIISVASRAVGVKAGAALSSWTFVDQSADYV